MKNKNMVLIILWVVFALLSILSVLQIATTTDIFSITLPFIVIFAIIIPGIIIYGISKKKLWGYRFSLGWIIFQFLQTLNGFTPKNIFTVTHLFVLLLMIVIGYLSWVSLKKLHQEKIAKNVTS